MINNLRKTSPKLSGRPGLGAYGSVTRGVIIAAMAGGLALTAAVPASAGTTGATFTLAGGSLTVSQAATATLDPGATGTTSITGALGAVDVTDARGSIAGWTMTAASTTFTASGGSVSTDVTYDSGPATASTGTVTPASNGPTSITTAQTVATGTAASGNNTASFSPTLTVTLPASALAGTYAGTVTTSVL
ncbi:hypothetical protein SAMN04515671_0148 [Nakamurella panacisegetis]|uniref:WxL domain surface cell wall-binding n=1 Tax=Nakamurella panacisegetis TaxID=1090615 RepID=A0A1H0HP80_9ACTN|nr:hypothetical protein [Nakamurella panacisegetis]SDO20863.1 hypothetical protein SAMN04515671_0148 [Nakamurella panacisegetis]